MKQEKNTSFLLEEARSFISIIWSKGFAGDTQEASPAVAFALQLSWVLVNNTRLGRPLAALKAESFAFTHQG